MNPILPWHPCFDFFILVSLMPFSIVPQQSPTKLSVKTEQTKAYWFDEPNNPISQYIFLTII